MRTYGRLLKNIAAIALLLALLSMLLPFCKFSAGGQEMTLSGLDVVKAGGRAGYTYLTEGRVADTFVLKSSGHGWYGKKQSFLCAGSGTDAASGSLCYRSTAPGAALFFVGGNVVSGRRKKDDDPAYAVYQSGAGRTVGRFGCVSGTVSVSVVRDIFLYPAARSRMDTHTDRMDYRRVPSTRKTGK